MRRELGMLVALVLMCLGLWLSNPDFLGQSNVINTTRQISMLAIYTNPVFHVAYTRYRFNQVFCPAFCFLAGYGTR